MPTNKVVLRTVEEFMQDYTPVYQPLYPLLLGKSQAYTEEVGSINFKRASTVGDIRAKHITPKDTEIRQIAVGESAKAFRKYFLANQFIQSLLQDQQGLEDVVAQVLDEHQKQMDELILLGEGTAGNNVLNNGLYWSNDPNYKLNGSVAIAAGTDPLTDFHARIMATAATADELAGRKAIIFYGTDITASFDSLYDAQPVPFKRVLSDVLGDNYSQIKLPSAITPAGAGGWIIVNLDQVKLHYTVLPKLADQGVNDEKMYSWHNFLMGSAMLEVLAPNAVIRQPATFA